MRCAWGKVILLLVAAVALLQVIHMLLLSRLELRQSTVRRSEDRLRSSAVHSAWLRDMDGMDAALRASSVLDSSGEFKVVNFLAHAEQSANDVRASRRDVTLVTHCSAGHILRELAVLGSRWDGPLSVAVFATSDVLAATVRAIATLRQCVPAIRLNASFHLVYPVTHQVPSLGSNDPANARCDCNSIGAILPTSGGAVVEGPGEDPGTENLVGESPVGIGDNSPTPWLPAPDTNYAYERTVYPNNLLRNLARRNAQTEYVFVVDVDMVPNAGLHSSFLQFASTNRLFAETKKDDKTVYVVPAFEAKEGTDMPRDKSGLLQLIEHLSVRPFYFELCWKCQKHTDYDSWQREPHTAELNVLFEVLWKDPWEPFYISRNTVPFYDERFKQYGFNRISQVCELHIAGYKFSVLNNAFLVHSGLKTLNSFHKSKDQDQERNRLLFRQFKTELKDKYPDSSRRCY